MLDHTDADYEALDERISRGDFTTVPGSELHGREAAQAGLAALLVATGASSFEEAVRSLNSDD
jgi:hypothetical protein